MIERRINVTEAARNFSEIINRAYYLGESVLLIKNNRAVARIMPAGTPVRTGAELADLWPRLPHLTREEGQAFASDLDEARRRLPQPDSKWE